MKFKSNGNHISTIDAAALHELIEVVDDFPKPGIRFRNVLPVLSNKHAFKNVIADMCRPYAGYKSECPDVIVGIESRGFIFGSAMANNMSVGFVPCRKVDGKLPGNTIKASYSLEYGESALQMQRGSIAKGARVAIVDDLLATGGTADAAARIVKEMGGIVLAYDFVVELGDLNGRPRLEGSSPGAVVRSLLVY